MIDSIENTGPVTRVRVASVGDEESAVAEAQGELGRGDYSEVVKIERGVYEVIFERGYEG